MKRMKPDMTWGGVVCPTNAKHGTLIMLPDGKYHCPHSDHVRESDGPISAKEYVFSAKDVDK